MIIIKYLVLFLVLSEAYSDEKSSLTFVIDNTGSMQDDIDQVKAGVNKIFDTVLYSKDSQIEDFVIVTFNDPGTKLQNITKDRVQFMDALYSIVVDGGGDCPELAMEGIIRGIENSRAGSTIYVLTDASAKDYHRYEDVKNMAINKQIQVVFLLTGMCTNPGEDYLVYHKLAKDTSGQVFHLDTNEMDKILIYVQENLKGRRSVLDDVMFPPGTHSVKVTFDRFSKDPTVSATGDRPNVDITGPDGKADTETIAEKDHFTIKKVVDPKPGDYDVKVSSPSKTHVVITAKTNIKFKHGFSTSKPSSVTDTTLRPTTDVQSHISIELTDGDIELKTVQILGMDNMLIKETPLASLNEADKLYTTDLEDLPDTLFKIAITGYDPISKETITRVGPPIQPLPRENKSPIVTILGSPILKPKPDRPLQLNCIVKGYPQPNIVWVNMDTGLELHGDVVVKNPSNFVSVLKIDEVHTNTNYECKAVNSLGTDSTSILLKVSRFIVLKRPRDISLNYTSEGELNCAVDAYPLASVTWYKNGKVLTASADIELSKDNSTLKIKEMHQVDDALYICEIRNEENRKVFSAKVTITGVEHPRIYGKIKSVVVPNGNDTELTCKIIKGFPKPKITWTFIALNSVESTLDEWSDLETITIRNADKTKAGTYSCLAKNEVGSDYHEVELVVEYPPSISNDEERITVDVGKSITVPCKVDGKPDPIVRWYKNDVELKKSVNLYIYKSHSIRMKVGLSDSGTYTCNATNSAGTASKVVYIDVYDPVKIALPNQTKMNVNVNTPLNLSCQVTGYPSPDTEWTYRKLDPRVLPKQMLKSVGSSVLSLKSVQVEDEGYYTCNARNPGGQSTITYEVHVPVYPAIEPTYLNKNFMVVEGDKVFIIKCNASGNPPPVISWMKNGYWVAAGDDFSIEDGTLIIKNVDKAANGLYSCEAKNSLGFDSELFNVTVQKYPQSGPPTSTVVVGQGRSSTVICDVPHKKTDLLRWYKNGALIHTGELTISNAKLSDSGLYTCRVSNFIASTSGNTLVKVGFPPKFDTDEETTIEFIEDSSYALNCKASGDPEPKTTWRHNGVLMNVTLDYYYFEMEMGTQGQYECEVTNDFGTITRLFDVVSRDCLLDLRKQPSKLQPLMISPYYRWPEHDVKNGFMSIPRKQYVHLVCPNRFKEFPLQSVMAFCEEGSKFIIRGKTYNYSDIECTEKVAHVIESFGESCSTGNTELLTVSFKVSSLSVVAYEICFDMDDNKPIYSTMRMGRSATEVNYPETEWTNDEVIDFRPDEAAKCDVQNKETSKILNRWFHPDDQCCFNMRMLVSSKDLFPGVPQRAAYSRLNVVPHWSTCNSESNNWNEVEERVRTLAKATYDELVVSTGVSENLTLTDVYGTDRNIYVADNSDNRRNVAKYIWKVVQDPASKSSLVIIQVNVPDLAPSQAPAYVRCRDICSTTEWMRGSSWYDVNKGFTFCCTLKDFEKSFGFGGVFKPYYNVLNDVSVLPDHSLT